MTVSLKEESSDDSTIISSQTSTLTRNQEPEYDEPCPPSYLEHMNQEDEERRSSENEDEDEENNEDTLEYEEEAGEVVYRVSCQCSASLDSVHNETGGGDWNN